MLNGLGGRCSLGCVQSTCVIKMVAHAKAKAEVGEAFMRGEAAASGAAAVFDVVAPGAASGGAAIGGIGRAGWVFAGTGGVVVGVVIVGAPFVHVVGRV